MFKSFAGVVKLAERLKHFSVADVVRWKMKH